jgi:uncharacterized Zn finger protein
MCKHVAAVLYGVGARLDQQPELLFRLCAVNEKELIASAGKALPRASKSSAKILVEDDLSKLFGLEIADSAPSAKVARSSKNKPDTKTPGAKKARITKGKPVAAKTKTPKKIVQPKAKPSAPTNPVAKKKPVPVLGKFKPTQSSATKKNPTAKSKQRPLPAATKTAASKAKPTRSAAPKASASSRKQVPSLRR